MDDKKFVYVVRRAKNWNNEDDDEMYNGVPYGSMYAYTSKLGAEKEMVRVASQFEAEHDDDNAEMTVWHDETHDERRCVVSVPAWGYTMTFFIDTLELD